MVDFPGNINWESEDTGINPDIGFPVLGYANLEPSGTLFVKIYTRDPDAIIDYSKLDFEPIRVVLGVGEPENEQFDNLLQIIGPDFDYSDKSVRGPFPDKDTVIRWLDETRLWAAATIWEDIDQDDEVIYWIEIDSD